MSEFLIKWLNKEMHLSKTIKEISEDFKNGYLFAELLYKTKQIQNLSQFKDSSNKKDIIHNFCLLNKTLLDMGINLNEKDRNEIMNGGIYASKIYLLKIKQILDKKCINLEQLNYKYSNDLQLLYNKMMFTNQNERYLYNLKIRLENEKNNILLGSTTNNSSSNISLTEGKINDKLLLDKKYSIGSPLYRQLKKKYSHLDLTDFDLEIILLDMKDEEIKINYLKEKVKKTEEKREKLCINKEKKEIKNWKSSILELKKNKENLIKEKWEPVKRFQKGCNNYFKKNALTNEKITKSFENDLNFYISEKNENENEENEENDENNEINMQKSMQLKNEIYMREIKAKLEKKLKSKKDKEKRERKRLKEEMEIFDRMNTEKNMSDMIKNMENNLNKRKIVSIKGDELIAKTEQLMNQLNPNERKRIKNIDELINKEINKENKNDEEKNKLNNRYNPKVNMNMTKFINQQNIEENKNKENINEVELEKEKEKENENENENEKETDKTEKKNEIINAEKSSYSKLTENDYGLNLINDTFKLHTKDINIKDRIKLFKTRLLSGNDKEQKYNNLPSLPNIITEEDENYNKQKSESNILNISTKNNNTNIFDKESFYQEMNKLNYENFLKVSKERKLKKEKKINIIKPIIDKMIEITEYISIYQENKGVQLLDNTKWDEIMDKFINWENIFDNEEDEIIIQDEVSEYLFDYGVKLTDSDNLILFDYTNYLNIFNDLIIPTSLRGKQFKYYEIYDEIYNSLNYDVDIKEYEPKEDEIENLILPKSPNFVNYKFYDIIENAIKNKYKNNEKNKIISADIFNSKYFYLPIKMNIIGYPMSGKKVQSSLINNKYPNIKIFDPEEIFENKLEEYKELKEPIEKSTKNKNIKPNQLDQLIKEREEKLEQFKPILNIIKPYLDYIEKNNEKDLNWHDPNCEEILTDIYINLLIYELEKVYPDNKESKNKLLEEINEKYKQYISIKEQIKEIKKNEEENKKENEEKGNKNKKVNPNFAKDLESFNKQLESIIPSLYVGFIFINFPKNINQAKKLENKITGFISEFEKPKDFVEEKLFNFNNIIDINIKQRKNGSPQISMFDLFFNLNITSEEVDLRYKGAKYDPNTKKVYNMEENPPNDKKVLERLLPGIPNFDNNRLKNEKELYDKNIVDLTKFYKIMKNGSRNIYINVDQMDKNYIKNINTNIEESMKEIIFENYYKNIEIIINNINKINSDNNEVKEETKNEEKEKEEKGKLQNEEKEKKEEKEEKKEEEKKEEKEKIKNEEKEKPELENNIVKIEENNNEFKNNDEKKLINYSLIKEIKANVYNFSEEVTNQFEEFASNYKNKIINYIHFILRQKEHIISYLTQIQNEYVLFLNRKTEKTSVAKIYINKYNSIINNHQDLINNPKVYNELLENIEDIGKSIWLYIQSKKNEDIQYLKNMKENEKLENELKKFIEFSLLIIEAEVKKYLVTCEIIIKYYLNQTGLLSNIIGIFENNVKINKLNEYLFKINHLNYLFNGIDIPENLFNININDDKSKINDIDKKPENEIILEDENEGENLDNNNNKSQIEKEKEKEKNVTKSELNETKKNNIFIKTNKKEKTLEEKLEIIFMNCLKIIVRQDLLMKEYKEKIKNFSPNNEKEIKKTNINKLLNSSMSSRSSNRKSKINKLSRNGFILYEEELSNQIRTEKQKFKYRLMFLKYFIPKYYNIIKECFNNTYNAMDDWIIMSVRSQNNSLNEFVSYLKKLLSKSNNLASLEDFEFDNFDIYRRYKVDISFIFDKIKLNSIVNLKTKNKKKENKNEIVLINENDMPYLDKYVYNINDLMYIYNYLKTFGAEGCEYLVKYEIVQEILIHHYFSKKNYGDLSKINNTNNNLENDAEINNKIIENNNSINLLKSSKSNNILLFNEENNGIPKIVLFISNINYVLFLNKFSEYNNNYININDLFTCLILIGSELITSEQFIDSIKEQLPDEKKNNLKHILLSKEEFLNINYWFENDKYLNSFVDEKEEGLFKYNKDNKDNNNEKMSKIIKIKNSIYEINEEEGKIDLYKIITLLDKLNGKIDKEQSKKANVEDMEKKEKNEKEENIKNNEENRKEIININDNKNEKENEIKEEEEEENNIKKDEEEEKENKDDEKKKENEEEEEINKDEINDDEEDEKKSNKESIINDETGSNQNESEILKNTKMKKNKKKKDEIINNIFNALFFN